MQRTTIDGNAAAAYISYAFSEIAVIYPITPSSPMAELADEWAAAEKPNLFGQVPKIVQMQSESGVAGALHGCLTCGGLATTYTCSQGLLLMLPDMYKIAGELLPTVLHVSARALSTHALSIFGDHQDVMACRQTGFAMLAASTVQEAADMALIAHLAALKTSIPFLHFFDGFRTSHETAKIELPDYEEILALVDKEDIEKFRARALDPDRPAQRGTAQNPDVYFQNREGANRRYLNLSQTVQTVMEQAAQILGRGYQVFDYYGDSEAEEVAVLMGSGIGTMEETVDKMNADGAKTGLIKVRLYRPFDGAAFVKALPASCRKIAVLDRTKEAGSLGEPLYLDVCAALAEQQKKDLLIVGGRYGLGSKEFTPAMCYAVFQNLRKTAPVNHFTVGIEDDITSSSLDFSAPYAIESTALACKFYGLGSDGTVGANKNSVKIIGNETDLYPQAYFCYDSKKSGGVTISHLRIDDKPIRSAYLIDRADFTACHNPSYLTRYDMLADCKEKSTFLLNCPWSTLDELNAHLPPSFKRELAKKRLSLFVIDATEIANGLGLKGKHSSIMQAAFFLLNPSLLPYEKAKGYIQAELRKKFARKGERVVEQNLAAVERAESALKKIEYPDEWATCEDGKPLLDRPKDEYFREYIQPILELKGDNLPVSAFSEDGTVPTNTTRLEKHGVAQLLPRWRPEHCIQCNQCAFVCPHATIRPFIFDENTQTPENFSSLAATGMPNFRFRIQVAAHDCMGCGVCAEVCPTKEKALVMTKAVELMPQAGEFWEFAQNLPQPKNLPFKTNTVKGSQFLKPLFEFSYACSGCGETPYIKVLTQLFGERTLIANATGCSSIYGGSSPTCPYAVNENGQGPAWANSLFEDNAEFGYGMKLACEVQGKTDRSVWLIGGDGWAYDIGYGGLDHVLASGENVNVLVLDSEVYSNTGGQKSKATPLGASVRFASAGKRIKKKNLGLMAMSYGYVYVAQVSMGANKQQFLNALLEAERYDGPSLILAYSPCIAHGIDMRKCMSEEKLAVDCGYWPLYRFNPNLKKEGKNPFILDSKAPTADFQSFLAGENRFAALKKARPELAKALFEQAERDAKDTFAFYQKLAENL